MLHRASGAETHINSIPSDVRRDLRRREKRLLEAGEVKRVALRTREELPRWIDEFLALEASGWKGRRGSALACSEVNLRFAKELFTRAFERGRLIIGWRSRPTCAASSPWRRFRFCALPSASFGAWAVGPS